MPKLYTLRDFYAEEGKSLRMDHNHYWYGPCRYRASKVCSTPIYFLFAKMFRINKWHKLDVLASRNKRMHCYSDICTATTLNKHENLPFFRNQRNVHAYV